MNEEEGLVFRLKKRAEIRRNISSRKSVQEGKPDRIAALLDEAAARIELLEKCASQVVVGWDDAEQNISSFNNCLLEFASSVDDLDSALKAI